MDSSSSFPPATVPSGVGLRRPSLTAPPTDPQPALATVSTPSLTTPATGMDASDDLQRRISRGSAAACLEAGNRLAADLHDEPPITAPLQWSRAAMFFITGIIWDTFLPHSTYCPESSTGSSSGLDNAACDHHDPSSLDSSDLSPLARSLITSLISLLQTSPLRRYEFTLPDLPNITSRIHRTALIDVLHSLGRTEENPHVSIATLSYRLANEFLEADELLPSLRVGGAKSTGSAHATDCALLGELSIAASMTHKTKSDCSSSMTGDDASVSAGSSYPATPLTRSRREIDLDESPATTPSQKSSTEDLTKVFIPQPTAFRNLLQERLSHKLHAGVTRPRSNTRSSSYASIYSSSSVRSTASSIFARMCGTSKAKSTVSVFAEPTSTMGSFTPVPVSTAAGSLQRYGPSERNGRSKTHACLPSERRRDANQPEVGVPRSPSPPKSVQRPGHARSSTISVVPSISLTHSSFQPEPVLESKFSHRRNSSSLSPPVEKPFAMAPALLERHTIGATARPKPKPPMSRTQSTPLPPLDATLAALEKSCRLRSRVTCACCGKVGWDFPKNRDGQALCSRECRVALKTGNGSALPSGPSLICA